MKTTLFALCLFSTIPALFSQNMEYNPSIRKPSKFTFGWVYSPEASYRILSRSELWDENTDNIIDSRNDSERAKFGQTVSVFMGYTLSKTFTLEGGIAYNNFGEAKKNATLPFNNGAEFPSLKVKYHIDVVSIPLSLNINLGGNRVHGFISAGIAPSYFMRYTSYSKIEYSEGSKETYTSYDAGSQNNFSKFILGAHISSGVDIKYSEKASLRIAPVFRITATDTYSDVPIKANYFNAGIEFGAIYKL